MDLSMILNLDELEGQEQVYEHRSESPIDEPDRQVSPSSSPTRDESSDSGPSVEHHRFFDSTGNILVSDGVWADAVNFTYGAGAQRTPTTKRATPPPKSAAKVAPVHISFIPTPRPPVRSPPNTKDAADPPWMMFLASSQGVTGVDFPASATVAPQDLQMQRQLQTLGPLPVSTTMHASDLGIAPSALSLKPIRGIPTNVSFVQNIVHSPTTVHSSPSPTRTEALAVARPATRRGLCGWNAADIDDLDTPVVAAIDPACLNAHLKRTRSPSPPLVHLANSEGDSMPVIPPELRELPKRKAKRVRKSLSQSFSSEGSSSDEDWEAADEDDASEDYHPSRSPSATRSRSESPSALAAAFHREFEEAEADSTSPKLSPAVSSGKKRKGTGKAKGSAAYALAMVAQMKVAKRLGRDVEDIVEEYRTAVTDHDGTTFFRKKKNEAIPLPVPVPNLHKKSRGRKVPNLVGGTPMSASGSGSGSHSTSSSGSPSSIADPDPGERDSRSRRRTSGPQPVIDLSGSRTYVCSIPGCGKGFVRGEHLKRHVRSIHTNDKPHPCPFEGCDKSFSRRDNLGQHVRIHLQPS